jgi:phosphate transport system protein
MGTHLRIEIEKLKTRLLALSAIVEDTVYRAVRALKERNRQLAQWVIDNDNDIDEREVDIEEECLKILALHQPVANDLRLIITVLKVNGELERIGDATVNIAERVLFLVDEEPVELPFDFPAMAGKSQDMLHRSLDALINEDTALAYEVIAADDEVDEMNRETYGLVDKFVKLDPAHAETYIHLLGISRHIERIGDHASNIAEDVVYLTEGTIVRHRAEQYMRQAKKP